jgi:signal transduction histidine kinase
MRASLCLLLWFASSVAQAQAETYDVAQLTERQSLTATMRWYRDDAGTASLPEVRKALDAGRFSAFQGEPSFGFTSAVHWVAFRVIDTRATPMPWILRLGYPLVDEITLYRVLPDGSVQRERSGDMRPFAERARQSVEFTFEERTSREPTLYFVRAQTGGSLRLPVTAWSPPALLQHERVHALITFLFLGSMAGLALYSFGVYLLIRQLEYLIFVAVVGLQMLSLVSFGGWLSALLPHQPELANRALPVALVGCVLLVAAFSVVVLRRYPELARETAGVQRSMPIAALMLAFTLTAPLTLALRAAIVFCAGLGIAGGVLLVRLDRARVHGVKLHVRGWMCLVAALTVQFAAAKLPPWSEVADWSAQAGCLLQGIVVSLALAQQLNLVKDRLASNVSELESALTRAEQATRVKDEFVATMSHELRTPLNAIINIPLALLEKFAQVPGARCDACEDQFALDEGERLQPDAACPSCSQPRLRPHAVTQYVGDAAQAQHYLALAERCGKHLLQMVNGVLDYSKIAAGKFDLQLAPTDPTRLLREACESMQEAAAEKGVTLRLELPNESSQLATLDELRIRQVLFNLLSNAIKFSAVGGNITVAAHEHEHELEVSVRDQGIGIAPEHHERIFSGFEQVHRGDNRKYGGSGLGLSISRSLVRMHGGELWVESELGQGSTFHFRTPRRDWLRARP